MVISGGVNIYPAEIEAELHKITDIADCAVFVFLMMNLVRLCVLIFNSSPTHR